MDNKSKYSDDLMVIKKMMEESTRFLSLSGLSGIFAGFVALAGSVAAHLIILKTKTSILDGFLISLSLQESGKMKTLLIADALFVVLLALAGSYYFSYTKSVKKGLKVWTPVSKRLLVNLFVPLIAGGFFILMLYIANQWLLIVPAMLIFYGLALVNAGKFTFSEVFYLGITEIFIGFLAGIFQGSPLLFWTFGFGLLHIGYGLFMYRKYER
jgi:predicted lysophospholipase L1 biosynthesis ABC-type transport system permease subunit